MDLKHKFIMMQKQFELMHMKAIQKNSWKTHIMKEQSMGFWNSAPK